MNDHSSLSKAFSKSIFRIMVRVFPSHFLKMVDELLDNDGIVSSSTVKKKLACVGPMIVGMMGLILYTMIFVTSL